MHNVRYCDTHRWVISARSRKFRHLFVLFSFPCSCSFSAAEHHCDACVWPSANTTGTCHADAFDTRLLPWNINTCFIPATAFAVFDSLLDSLGTRRCHLHRLETHSVIGAPLPAFDTRACSFSLADYSAAPLSLHRFCSGFLRIMGTSHPSFLLTSLHSISTPLSPLFTFVLRSGALARGMPDICVFCACISAERPRALQVGTIWRFVLLLLRFVASCAIDLPL